MVRLSTPNDLNGIVSVWKEAFGDSEKDIRFFLDNHYKADNAVVYDSNGEVASVLFLIDGFMHIKGKDYPSYYLYAACTMKKYRGRGIMSEMLEFTKNIAFNRQKIFVALKPAEDSLYNYYSRFGYQPVFSKKKAVFELTDITDNTSIINNETDIDFSLLKGRNCSYCFKDAYLSYKNQKNQVHTRAIHAEEMAFLQAAKIGTPVVTGGYLFTTASPCELCSKW